MSPLLLGIDVGTSSVKAALYRLDGSRLEGSGLDRSGLDRSRVAAAAVAYPTQRAGLAEEQRPADWWAALAAALAQVLPAGEPSAIGLTGQMSGVMLADAYGEPLTPFLPWSDRRATAEADRLAAALGGEGEGELYRTTGCRAAPGYPAAKLLWLRQHRPDAWRAARQVLGAREYLLARLTGRLVTDPSAAGASQLYDLRAGGWWAPMLQLLELDPSWLPPIRPPWAVAGLTGPGAATLGLSPGIPVAVGAGDGPCSSWGAGARQPGDVVVSMGTSGVIRAFSQQPLIHPQAATTCYPLGDGLFAGTGVVTAAGAALEWTAGVTGLPDVRALEGEASQAPPGAGGVLFVPHLSGSRTPDWNPAATGTFFGLRHDHGRPHLARAAIEGVAASLTVALGALREAGAHPARLLITGGAGQNQLLIRTIAGLTGLPTLVAPAGDATLGAAQMAAVAAGLVPAPEAARVALAPQLNPVEPAPVPADLTERYTALTRALSPCYKE